MSPMIPFGPTGTRMNSGDATGEGAGIGLELTGVGRAAETAW